MENWLLVKLALVFLGLCVSLTITPGNTTERQEIRFYKANKQLQTDRIRFTRKKGRLAGCHNFIKKSRVFKVVQFGYQTCVLYAQKECLKGSELKVTREKNDAITSELTEGFGWLPIAKHKRGAKLKSWFCEEK